MPGVDSDKYYDTYHGHAVEDLQVVHDSLRETHTSMIFFAGTSLDNKKFLEKWAEEAVNGYEKVLTPPRMKEDICYHLNSDAVTRHTKLCCLNTAVAGSSLNDRAFGQLLDQDQFMQDHVTSDDYVVVSVGGNDIALVPLMMTILNLAALIWCAPQGCIERCACACPVNSHVDLGSKGYGLPGCISGGLCGWPLGMGYLVDLFANRVGNYVRRLIGDKRPKKVVICMLYFLDEAKTGSWADQALTLMRYDNNPGKLQGLMRKLFQLATSRIQVPGVEVVAFPLFDVLDGKTSSDYIQRVEASDTGGAKIAHALMDLIIDGILPNGENADADSSAGNSYAAPCQESM